MAGVARRRPGDRLWLTPAPEWLDHRYMQTNKTKTNEIISAARIARAVAAGSVAIFALALAIAL